MAAKVFLCYRRDDSAAYAGRVQDRLAQEFGRDLLFMDVDTVPLGVNFVTVLHNEIAKCEVLLAVIGPNWLDARDDAGNRRLDDPHDFVRIEIGAALQRNIPVIPILLDGAKVPKANQLPKELEELSFRNGLDVRHASFHSDVDRLVRSLKGQLAEAEADRPRDGDARRRKKPEDKRRLAEAEASGLPMSAQPAPRELVVFRTKQQRTYLRVSKAGIECHLDDDRPEKRGHQWTISRDEASRILQGNRILVNPDHTDNSGLFTIGDRRNWMYSKKLFPEPSLLEQALRELLEAAAS
jgi:hypothetical protein